MLESFFERGLLLLAAVTPISIAATNIVFFPILAVWVLGSRRTFSNWPPVWGLPEKLFLIFLAMSLVSAALGVNPAHSFHEIRMKDFYISILVLLVALIRREDQAFGLLKVFMVAGLLTALWGLVQAIISFHPMSSSGSTFRSVPAALANWPRPVLDLLVVEYGRSQGTRSHPIHYAECLLFIWPVTISFLVSCPRRELSRWVLATLLIGSALLVSQSRGPWLAAAVLWLLALTGARSRRAWALLSGSIFLLAVIWKIPALHSRAATLVEPSYRSNEERLQMWQTGLSLWKSHPWLGIGPGNVKRISAALPEDSGRPPEGWGHLHSTYVNFAAERGLAGLGTYLLMIAALCWELWKAMRRAQDSSTRQIVFRSTLLGVIGFLICGLTETAYNTAVVQMTFYFVVGLTLALARRC